MNKLKLYTAFHLNLAYSSIEEEQRQEVIQKCYWPLLRIARKLKLPFGIEATGYTLQSIKAIDPSWTDELKRLVTEGNCEFIASGYSQLIGPIVPPEVNAANLRLGNQVYKRLLGLHPEAVLVNEQAYSAGLVRHYLDAGYKAMLMDWDNPACMHPEWCPEYRYLPQRACGQDGSEIPLIWTNSIAFQEFQRYAHGELDRAEYLSYLARHLGSSDRTFPIYCNDIEIFNFRPGRYHTEAILKEDEWARIEDIFQTLLSDDRFVFIKPMQSLDLINLPAAGNRLHLESSGQPIPVKKQSKYNITRWAVTGRDDVAINSACRRIYEALISDPSAGDEKWTELCYLWSSDFRTHITQSRWSAYKERLGRFEREVCACGKKDFAPMNALGSSSPSKENCTCMRNGRYLVVQTKSLKVNLNLMKGASIDGLWFKDISDEPLCGTLPHGYYDDINWGADYYTGHLILETPGRHKITDLSPVDPEIESLDDRMRIIGVIPTSLGPIKKSIDIFYESPKLGLNYHLDWKTSPIGSLRLGNITLNPEAFQKKTLFYRTKNGGYEYERFPLNDIDVEHGKSVSLLVSATNGIGLTNGIVEIGDAEKLLITEVDMSATSPIGLITCKDVGDNYFCRLALSLLEVDETCKNRDPASEFQRSVCILLSARSVQQI
jgi:hypothetical protein